ncbi:hypothetical protein [Rickettsiella endosymbiont of Rhagonycha lignosa]|uniref:hypothetical protein n=1 Tax=Rickettsiella endosymbiont of Rhagonycha lignosa TaxID=3077937 RepID=UPI00313F1458
MTIENNLDVIIKKTEKQCEDIINKNEPGFSKNFDLIRIWIVRNKNEFLCNIKFAIIIDTIYQFFQNKCNEEKTSFIENCLCHIINEWSNLSEGEIQEIACQLKTYTKTNDTSLPESLKRFIPKSDDSLSFFRDISKKLMSTCQESLSNLSSTFKTKLSTPSAVELGKEAWLSNQFPFFEDASPETFTNNPAIYKKRIKTRVIAFDEEGIGYDISSPYLYLKEINRLNNINLEIELPAKFKKKLLQEQLLSEELERLGRIELNQESYLNKLKRKVKIYEFDFFASKEEKDARQRNIEQKIENDKKHKKRQKISKLLIPTIVGIQEEIELYKKAFGSKSLSIESSLFETGKDDFLVAFLKTIDYEKFKELINFSEYLLNSIDKIRETFKKIDDFSENLGIASNYIGILDSYYRHIKENFSRERIANFLEEALILFEKKTLLLGNNYSLLDIQAKNKKEIVFSKHDFLDEFIANNNAKQILKLLSEDISAFFHENADSTLIRNNCLEKSKNILKQLFNYFSGNYYFFNENFKDQFVKKFLSNIQEGLTLKFIRVEVTKLKWWHFIFRGISPGHVFEKGFKERLSEKLYLKLLEEKFKKIEEKQEPNAENIDKLYAIKNDINSFKNKIQGHSINLNSLNVLDSRQSIVDRLKKHEEIKQLLDNVLILSDQASSCINEFHELKYVCKREIEKVSENNEIFQLNKNDISKLHFPLKGMK